MPDCCQPSVTERSAHWEPTYRFSATGRTVHNVIDAEFEFDAAGVFVLNRRVPLGQDTGGRVIAGMAAVGFDDTPRDEDPMLRRGEGIIGHVIATGQTVSPC